MKQIQARQDETLKLIKEIILKTAKKYNIEIDKIILFGSRARGDYREDSDWDILIVTKKKLREDLFWKLYRDIKVELSIKMKIPNDLIIVSKDYYEDKKGDVGNISYYAAIEGKIL